MARFTRVAPRIRGPIRNAAAIGMVLGVLAPSPAVAFQTDAGIGYGGCRPPSLGTDARDEVVLPATDDAFDGLAGSDRINGGGGNDCLFGNSDGDTVDGADGNDVVAGGRGPGGDVLLGGPGNDDIDATEGPVGGLNGGDVTDAGAGDDDIKADDGYDDVIECGPGEDRVDADPIDSVAASCEQRVDLVVDTDIVHVYAYDGNPAEGGSEVAEEYVRVAFRSARRLIDSGGFYTQVVVPCGSSVSGCLESRSYDFALNVHATVLGASPADDRVSVSEAIDAMDNAVGAPADRGLIADVLAPWQAPPPGHGAEFELFETTEDATVDGVDMTLRDRVWVDATTGLPLREQMLEGGNVVEEQFYSYAPERLSSSEVSTDFFRPPPPAGAQTNSYTLAAPGSESAALAASPALSSDQRLHTAREYRAAQGFTTDATVIERLAGDPPDNGSIARFGVPLTDRELAEKDRRLAVQRARGLVEALAARQETFAGSYIDHATGGLLHIGFTKGAASQLAGLRAAFPYPNRLRTFSASRSLVALYALQDQVDNEASTLPFPVTVTGIDQRSNQVVVGATDVRPEYEAALRARYGAGVRLEQRNPQVARRRVRAGTFVSVAGGPGCTLGFGGFRRSAGRKYHYQLTAGHCLPNFRSRIADHGRPALDALSRRFGRVVGNSFPEPGQDSTSDAASILLLPQSARTSRVRLETRSGRNQYYRVVGRLDGVGFGDEVCQYGQATGYTVCGQVTDTNDRVGQNEGSYIQPLVRVKMSGDCTVADGDSGGPVFDTVSFRGLLAGGLIHAKEAQEKCETVDEIPGFPDPGAPGDVSYVSPVNQALDDLGLQLRVAP